MKQRLNTGVEFIPLKMEHTKLPVRLYLMHCHTGALRKDIGSKHACFTSNSGQGFHFSDARRLSCLFI